jgi:hypothetical protein
MSGQSRPCDRILGTHRLAMTKAETGSCSSVLAEAARELEAAAHDAWVAFDCVALGEFDRLVPYPADVPTQYRVLVPEDQQFSVLRQVPAGCQDSQAEYPAN